MSRNINNWKNETLIHVFSRRHQWLSVSGGLWTWVHVFSRRHQQCQWRIMDIDTCNWQTAPAIRVSVVNYGHWYMHLADDTSSQWLIKPGHGYIHLADDISWVSGELRIVWLLTNYLRYRKIWIYIYHFAVKYAYTFCGITLRIVLK